MLMAVLAVIMMLSNNHIIVDGGTVTNTLQGGVLTANGDTELGNAVNNKVTIKNGTIDASVYGGAVNGEGNATGNEVIIESGTITGMVLVAVLQKMDIQKVIK